MKSNTCQRAPEPHPEPAAVRLYQVDAFTNEAFRGNPAAVCVMDSPAPKNWMQSLAAEMNLSETAFVHPASDGQFGLRWFTPEAEVALCGHATLATAHVLFSQGHQHPLHFQTKSGVLEATKWEQGIQLDFPALLPSPASPPAGLLEALGVEGEVHRSRYDYLVKVADAATVEGLSPNFQRLKQVEARGVIVTAPAATPFDFLSRFFAPRVGVDEDPVTGSAHCVLAPYWGELLGKTEMRALQASQRTGELQLCLQGERVLLRGQAIMVFEGVLSPGADMSHCP